ncbi:hypothetical protein Hanom_Chr11g01043531 [Helianthus anomalus]
MTINDNVHLFLVIGAHCEANLYARRAMRLIRKPRTKARNETAQRLNQSPSIYAGTYAHKLPRYRGQS